MRARAWGFDCRLGQLGHLWVVLREVVEAWLATVPASTVDEDEFAAFTALHCEVGEAGLIFARKILSGREVLIVNLMEALVAGHKVEGVLAVTALPGNAFVSPVGGEALGLFALVADDIAALEATLAAADRAHPVLHEVHQPRALEAEEIVQFVWALLALDMLEQFEWELVAEYKEVGPAGRAFDERGLRSLQFCFAGGVHANYLVVH